jgi:hypothetical protein
VEPTLVRARPVGFGQAADRASITVHSMTIVDDLLAHPGTYIGIDTSPRSDVQGAARMVVTPLPGGVGVSIDYEILNPTIPDHVRGHIEHTVVARTHDGATMMFIAHDHGDTLAIMRETEPGRFELEPNNAPYPMRVDIAMTQPGTLRHAWSYGMPGEDLVERDIAILRRLD